MINALEMERLSGCDQCNHEGLYERMWGNQSQRGGHVTMEAVTGMILIEEGEGATCQCKWPLEAKKCKETNFPLEPSEERLPTDILTLKPRKTNFGLLVSITIRG